MTAQQTFRNTVIVIITLLTAYLMIISVRILIVLLMAIILASALRPSIIWLGKRRVPLGLSIMLVYVLLFAFLFTLGVLVLPPAISQLLWYLQNENGLAYQIISGQMWLHNTLLNTFHVDFQGIDPEQIRTAVSNGVQQIQELSPQLISEAGALMGDFILVVVMGIYWFTSRDQTLEFLSQIAPLSQRPRIITVFNEVEQSLGAYLRGVVSVCTIVGIANFALLTLFGVPNAITLAFIIGATTALPIIGGYIGAGTAVFLAFLSSPIHAIATFGSFVLVQQVENHYLTPRTMARSTNMNPILVILVLFTGIAVGGVGGGILAVPIASMVVTVLKHFVIRPMKDHAAPTVVDGVVILPAEKPANGTSDTPSNGIAVARP